MPTAAFFKLDEQKRNSLLKSAVHEFSALPYEKVSIFKIAQNAGVSRSGFYYYFKDKEDIYRYLIDRVKEKFDAELKKENKKYDIFSFSKKIFNLVASVKGTDREALIKQIVANSKPDDVSEFLDKFEYCAAKQHFEYLHAMNDLKVTSRSEIAGLTWLLICSCVYSLQRYFSGGETLAAAEERLDQLFEMIKRGVMK